MVVVENTNDTDLRVSFSDKHARVMLLFFCVFLHRCGVLFSVPAQIFLTRAFFFFFFFSFAPLPPFFLQVTATLIDLTKKMVLLLIITRAD